MTSIKSLALTSVSKFWRHNRKESRGISLMKKVVRWLVIITVTTTFIGLMVIGVNHLRTAYTIKSSGTNEDIRYLHEDERTTNIVNYLTGEGTFPKEERLPVYRQYVKNMLEEAEMTIPNTIYTMEYSQLNALAIKWYRVRYPNHPKDMDSQQELIEKLFDKAVRPPLEGFGPDVDGKIWRLLIDVGSPKVRWMEEQDELPARFVAYSAGDKKSFYDPTGNTIYIAYNNSVRALLNEVGHPKQFRENQIRSWMRLIWPSVVSFVKAEADPGKFFNCYKGTYEDPLSFEGEAHGVMKDELLTKHGLQVVNKQVPAKQTEPEAEDSNPRQCGDSFCVDGKIWSRITKYIISLRS